MDQGQKQQQQAAVPESVPVGNAVILLHDWDKYGLAERVCYHFDLVEALPVSPTEQKNKSPTDLEASSAHSGNDDESANTSVCGVSALLECVPQGGKLRGDQKRKLKTEIKSFNAKAQDARKERKTLCHQPPVLPLRITSLSNIVFAYETTRIAFCLDASPTLTSTFGFSGRGTNSPTDAACCPLDMLVPMARTFFTSLAMPIRLQTAAHLGQKAVWQPDLTVSVLAVFPGPQARLLVRDFRIRDVQAVELLVDKMAEWALGEVESEIASRLARPDGNLNIISSFEAGMMPLYSSTLRDLLDASDAALSTLSSAARPLIVLATDGRSVSCDAIIDTVSDRARVDVPLVVLDLSSEESHAASSPLSIEEQEKIPHNNFHMLSYDPVGALFPLHLSDDMEALFRICKATDGCFFDSKLLHEASQTFAGQVEASSPLYADPFFSLTRHPVRPNAVQWYTLFSLSPLSPRINSNIGKLASPSYIHQKLLKMEVPAKEKADRRQIIDRPVSGNAAEARRGPSGVQNRSTFWTYIVNPIRIKGLLITRIKEGYRAKNFRITTQEPEKVSVQFMLPLDLDNVLHYELTYRALPGHNHHSVGFAHVKIELSGESSFIKIVKNDFLSQGTRVQPVTMAQQVSLRLCELLRWIRKEDTLQSYLSPLRWTDQLLKQDTPFVKRLGTLTTQQRHRFFRRDEFDCVCHGINPYDHTDDFLREFRQIQDGEVDIVEAVDKWSTQIIQNDRRYVKRIQSASGDLANYCVVELSRTPLAAKVFTVSLETFVETDPTDRLSLVVSLRRSLGALQSLEVLPKQMGRFLVRARLHEKPTSGMERFLECQHNHASWDLVKDPELLPLLMRRRTEIGSFLLLDWTEDYALFAKLQGQDSGPGDLLQYQLAILEDKVVVDFHMESASSAFLPLQAPGDIVSSNFHKVVRNLKKRDQECGRALCCRTSLLRVFDGDTTDTQLSCVRRLLAYSSKVSIRLRFFHQGSGSANSVLRNMTEETLLANSFGPKVAKLSNIGSGSIVGDVDEGDWFVVEYDKHTMSLTHLSSMDNSEVSEVDGRGITYRSLTFFTIAISDLYNRRDDLADDASDVSHISEYLCVTEFTDLVEMAHKQNYASAAYVALKSESSLYVEYFNLDDFAEVLRTISFVEVAKVDIAGESGADFGMRSKLSHLIQTVLRTIPDESYCLYYKGGGPEDMFPPLLDDASDALSVLNDPLEALSDEEDESNGESSHDDDSAYMNFEESAVSNSGASAAPLFVRFMVDRKPVSVHDLACIEKESSLSVLLSVFNDGKHAGQDGVCRADPSQLPSSHLNVAVELAGLLNAFVAEQTLERLRLLGKGAEAKDLRLAKSCMRKARDVVTATIEVFFYVAKVDSMFPASVPTGCDAEVEVGFKLLLEQLEKNKQISLEPFGGGFVVVDTDQGLQSFACWCFVNVRRILTVEVYHPRGPEMASEVLSSMHELISMCCHRVNQLLLLQRLHQSRVASSLLIPSEEDGTDGSVEASESGDLTPFHAGLFRCPVVFQTSFDLFHRCATNPSQVARTIEATVFHVFSTNHPGVFVYRDESGSVFYMRLVASGGGVEADGKINLLVYGIDEPGPSVTRQLTALLKKRLLSIAVDMLSSLLTKNPNYYWRYADLSFVRSFEVTLKSLEDESSSAASGCERIYAIPCDSIDPVMLFVFFRQNFCGSTYCHTLKSLEWRAVGGRETKEEVDTTGIRLDSLNFVFFYNNAPSKVNPKFQHLSTLTSKGAEYARQVGNGIAIIELQLIDCEGQRVRVCRPPTAHSSSPLATLSHNVKLQKANDSNHSQRIRVKITDTALKRDVLHNWILLSLNQALVDWTAERHLESIQQGRWAIAEATIVGDSCESDASKNAVIESISPGLPTFSNLLTRASNLPHPAIRKSELQGVVRSSTVASAALDLLERTIFDQLFKESNGQWSGKASDTTIIRLSRSERPRRVMLQWDANGKAVVWDLSDMSASTKIVDAPIDCPQYLCFYCSPDYLGEDDRGPGVSPRKLFEQVALTDGSDESTDLLRSLEGLKQANPTAFQRSFAFVFSVKRNQRVLLSYNWTPEAFTSTTARLQERNNLLLVSTEQSSRSHQNRCLRMLSPMSASSQSVMSAPTETSDDINVALVISDSKRVEADQEPQRLPPSGRRATRPSNIRRPKLIGKSVEGSALHAVAASRARASSKMFKATPTASSVAPKKGLSSEDSTRSPQGRLPSDHKQIPQSQSTVPTSADDRALTKVRMEYHSAMRSETDATQRFHSLQQRATLFLSSRLWPIQPEQSIPTPVAHFLLSNEPFLWSDVAEFPLIPKRILSSFLTSFGRTLCAWVPGLRLLPRNSEFSRSENSILLMGNLKNVRNCKSAAVVEVMVFRQEIDGVDKTFVRCNGWAVVLPRRHQHKYNSRNLNEKDSAGIDRLTVDMHMALPLQNFLFDYLSSIAEHTMKSVDPGLGYSEVSLLVQQLLCKYELSRQLQMPRSNYKAFRTAIILSSYCDRLISEFEAPVLFRWLSSNAESFIVCGRDGLCFKRELVVRGTHSICFLTCDPSKTGKMDLILLCRTQGRDLMDFTFRESSNIAISILDCIAVEAAGLAYWELRAAATRLRLDRLWRQISGKGSLQTKDPSPAEIKELLHLSIVKPFTEVVSSSLESQLISMIFEDGLGNTDWRSCCNVMGKDPAFSPSWKVSENGEISSLFYVSAEDKFILITTDAEGHGCKVAIVELPESNNSELKLVSLVSNFLLHYIWSDSM